MALLRRLHIPSIAGFILTGVLIGPTVLGWVRDPHQVEILAEIGVILLLFGIGLELSLERLKRLWRAVLIGGGIQVALTIAVAAGIGYGFGLTPGAAIFVGCVIAVSSTAVVLRGLSRRGEIDAPHGRLAVGILVFQDLSVVPMILAVPFLSGRGGTTQEVLITIGTAAAILIGVVVAAGFLVPRILGFVGRTRQRDLFILSVFLVCFGIAWAVSLAGISLALGAFLGGLVVAGSEFRHQAMSDMLPVREALASLFFISVGMLLDLPSVLADPLPTLGLLAAILVGKFVIILLTAVVALRLPLRVGILSAATLCQVGEFSFVLLKAAGDTTLIGPELSNELLAAIILSMLLTPLLIAFGPHLAGSATRVPWLDRLFESTPPGVEADEPHANHVIVAGYGYAGRQLCHALRETGVPYVGVDLNPDNVRSARAAGDRFVLGDITQPEVLEELGCHAARLIVIGINDPDATERATRVLRRAAPGVPILARTSYEMDREGLREAGASQVITAEATAGKALVDACIATLSRPGDSPGYGRS